MAKTVRIGHASTDSAATAAAEVLISNYYTALKPTVVLRPVSSAIAEKSAAACEAGCNNNNIEYSQIYRNSLYNEAKKVDYNLTKVSTTCYADCSSFMTVCAIAGGANIDVSSMPNCGSMKAAFTKHGDYKALTSSTYLNSSDYLQRGDILVRETFLNGSRHTVMVLDNGGKVQASSTQDAGQTLVYSDVSIIKIAASITNIDTSKIDISARVTKLENGVETILTDSSTINTYKWTYELAAVNSSANKVLSEKLKVSNGTIKFTLSNLSSGEPYKLKILAKEIDGSADFSSPTIIFTTANESPIDKTKISFGSKEPLTKINKIYLKVKDSFKRAMLYNN